MVDQILAIINGLAASFPVLTTVLAVLYIVGIVAKIVREAVEGIVLATPSPKDDAALKKAEESKIGKAALFVLDVLLRIKKPQASSAPVKAL